MWSIHICVWVSVCVCASRAELSCEGQCTVRCTSGLSNTNEHEFTRKDTNQTFRIQFKNGGLFRLSCNNWTVLEFDGVPRFRSTFGVPAVELENCPLPARGSIARALAAFNVQLLDTRGSLSLQRLPGASPPLAATHFTGLEHLASLKITGSDSPALAADFLEPLCRQDLKELALENVRLLRNALVRLPASLRNLTLINTSIRRLPALPDLTNLTKLELFEERLEFSEKLKLPKTLIKLNLRLKNTTLEMDSNDTIEDLTLKHWSEKWALIPRGPLRRLELERPAVERLPARWLASCPSLEHLTVKLARKLKSLPANLLEGAGALTHITLMNGILELLPENLFNDQIHLISLDLTNNKLSLIPSGMFVGPRLTLQVLNLSHNALNASVWDVMESLDELTDLNLSNNPNLGNDCQDETNSKLYSMEKLTSLNLERTGIKRICQDWRQHLRSLKELNLRHTDISVLWRDDLQFRRDSVSGAKVYLQGARITSVRFSEADYNKSGTKLTAGLELELSPTEIVCDCRMYWTLLAIKRANGSGPWVKQLKCATHEQPLNEMSEDDMQCPADDVCRKAGLPPECACTAQPWLDAGAGAGRMLVKVRCENASLRRVPQLRATAEWIQGNSEPTESKMSFNKKLQHDDVWFDLLLANNNISSVSGADLQPRAAATGSAPPLHLHLRELDLTNNSIERVDDSATILISQQHLRVHLAGNPLRCDCGVAPLLRALSRRDLGAATCRGGGALAAVSADLCAVRVSPPYAWLVGALLALVAAAALLIACLLNRELRLIFRLILNKLGLLGRPAEKKDDCLFDAFISFSHEDEKIVCELVERLESGPTPHRLCLHYRDWVPGRFIPDQIVESVRASRRTVALVSRHFLNSTWACAEFREAYALAMADVSPRLVVVLLEDPATLPLDRQLRRYLRSNTYVRWGDPWFWGKLELALPIPQARVSEPSPPPAPVEGSAPSAVSLGAPLERSLSEDRQSGPIDIETLAPDRFGKTSPLAPPTRTERGAVASPPPAPHLHRSPAVAVAT